MPSSAASAVDNDPEESEDSLVVGVRNLRDPETVRSMGFEGWNEVVDIVSV
jgi:hypothetical protein